MTFFTALASVVNANIASTRILDCDKADLDLMEDAAIQLGYARVAKEQYDQAVKDSENSVYCASDRQMFAECAKDHAKEFNDAQLALIEISSKVGVMA